jgi:hypothetical protein
VIGAILRFLASPGGRVAMRALPLIVREIDSWISTRSYEEASARIEELRAADAATARRILQERRADMSPEVARAYEDALRSWGGES